MEKVSCPMCDAGIPVTTYPPPGKATLEAWVDGKKVWITLPTSVVEKVKAIAKMGL